MTTQDTGEKEEAAALPPLPRPLSKTAVISSEARNLMRSEETKK